MITSVSRGRGRGYAPGPRGRRFVCLWETGWYPSNFLSVTHLQYRMYNLHLCVLVCDVSVHV